MFDKWIDTFTLYIFNLVSKLNTLRSNYNYSDKEENEEENINEEKVDNISKKSIFDDIDKLKIEILPIKLYFPNIYTNFLEEIESIFEKCKKYYEEESKEYEFHLTIGVSPENDSEILKKLTILSKKIREFKKSEFNFVYVSKRLDELLSLMDKNYPMIMIKQDRKVCTSFELALEKIVSEAHKLEYAEDLLKKEEISLKIAKAIYYIHKYKVRCGYTEDSEFEDFVEEEELNILKSFNADVEELIKKVEVFKGNKHYTAIKQYFERLTVNIGKYNLNDLKFFLRFLEKEKKTYELHFFYLNKNENK